MRPSRVAIVEEELPLTVAELCQASFASEEEVITWVLEGVLEPIGESPKNWRFTGKSLSRARVAIWLTSDLEVNASGVAFALDLMDEIAALRAKLARLGWRSP
jgi:chaperone modulatory protein CbpM